MSTDFRIALRSLLKRPGFFVTAVASLALALGAGVAAFSVIDAVRFRALPFRDGGRLVVLGEVPSTRDGSVSTPCQAACTVSYTTYANVLRITQLRTVDEVAAYTSGGKAVARDGDVVGITGGVVSPNVFTMLGAHPIIGRTLTPEDDRLGAPLAAVLSYGIWVTLGGDTAIVGRDLKLSDSHYTVVGVMEPGFDFESGSQFWLPVVPTLDPSTNPGITAVTVFAHLAPGASIAQLRAELAALDLPHSAGSAGASATLVADPLRARYVAATRSYDLAFAGIVACVLLIACANLANLVLIRTIGQRREFAVRAALGANARQVARAVIAQNVIVVAVAAAIGTALASSLLGVLGASPLLSGLRPSAMVYRLDARVLGFGVLLALAAGALISVIPLRVARRGDVSQLLRGSGGAGVRRRTQRVFVVAQIACTAVLVTGGALLARTVLEVSHVQAGFDIDRVLTASASFPHTWRDRKVYTPVVDRIVGDLRAVPGVASVAVRVPVPLAPRNASASVFPEGRADPLAAGLLPAAFLSVSAAYFSTMGVRVAQGRAFDEHDADGSAPVAIVNQWAAAHWWPGASAVGRTMRVENGGAAPLTLTVVGVVDNNKAARPSLLLAQDGPELYRPFAQAPSPLPAFFVRALDAPRALVPAVRALLTRAVPDRPVFTALLSQNASNQLAGVERNATQMAVFACIGLVLALVGVYGVLAYDVHQRVREIGIRGALGATQTTIARGVLRDAAALTATGLIVGVPLAVLASRLIRTLLYGTSPTDPLVYAAVIITVAAVSMLAALIPARRASSIDPATALRGE